MPRISTSGENDAATGFLTGALYISLHSADPGVTGVSEITGTGYARQAVAWNAPANGSATNAGALNWQVPAGTTVAYVGLWDSLTGGVYKAGGQTPSVTYSQAGQASIAAGALTVSPT